MTTDPGCYFHGVEPILGDIYRLCGECGHAWRTETELIDAYLGSAPDDMHLERPVSGDEVFFCPLCIHDF